MRDRLHSSAGRMSILLGAALALSAGGARPAAGPRTPQAVKPDATRQAHMQVHFSQVMTIHEAVIRGDLAAVKDPASWLATHEPPASLPDGSAPYIAAMREAAKRTAAAATVLEAATGTASMLKTCGDCHRGVGTMPAVPITRPRPDVHGLVGHMLSHQHGADQMLQGLSTPSSALWRAGAAALKTASVDPGDLPRGAKLGPEARASEERLHVLAGEAARVEDAGARAVFYAQILARCADCHVAHRKAWGPSRR